MGPLDRDPLRRAEVVAAKLDASVSALFRTELTGRVESFEAGEANANGNYRALVEFARGRTDAASRMVSLGIDAEEELFLPMARARLPMPRLPEERTDATVDALIERHAG